MPSRLACRSLWIALFLPSMCADESTTGSGSAAYVPPDPKDDLQLIYAEQLLRGQKTDPAFPPNPEKAVLNQ